MGDPVKGISKIERAKAMLEEVRELKAEHNNEESIELGLKALKLLGISIKKSPGLWSILKDINKTKAFFSPRKIRKIPQQSALNSAKSQLQLDLLTALTVPALKVNEDLWTIILMWIARISIKKGNSDSAAIGYAGFALISVRYLEDDLQAEALYRVSIQLLETYKNPITSCIVKYILAAYVAHMFVPWHECIQLLDEGAKEAFESEDLVVGGLCLSYGIEMAFASGSSLADLQIRIAQGKAYNVDACDQDVKIIINLYEDYIKCNALPDCSSYEEIQLPDQSDSSLHLPVHLTQAMLHMTLAYNYARYEEGAELLNRFIKEINDMKVHLITGIFYHYESMIITRRLMEGLSNHGSKDRRRLYQLKSLFQYWVKRNPYIYGYSYKMCEGSIAHISGDFSGGEEAYDKAIQLAKNEGSLYGQAVGTIALAHHCRHYGREHMATYYMEEGADLFKQWQGIGISNQILVKEQIVLSYDEIQARWQDQVVDETDDYTYDLYALTERIQLDERMLNTLLDVVISQFAGNKVLLFMDDCGQLKVQESSNQSYTIGSNLESLEQLSSKTIKHVFRNRELVLMNDDEKHRLANFDAYVMDHGTGCILSVPMVCEESCIGVLYVEREKAFEHKEAEMLQRLLDYVSYLYCQKVEAQKMDDIKQLTSDDQTILDCLVKGMTIKEISLMTGHSLNQLLQIIKRLYPLLDAVNLYELVVNYQVSH